MRNRVDRASATASRAVRTARGATWVSSQPAAAALQAVPMVGGSVTIAIAVVKDWPVFQRVMTGCTQPASPQVSTVRATGRPGSRSNLSATTPGASNPAATVAIPGSMAASTPHARPDSQTTDRLLPVVSPLPCRAVPCFAFGGCSAVAIHLAQSGKDQSDCGGGEPNPCSNLLTQPVCERRTHGATLRNSVQLGVDVCQAVHRST